MASIIDQMYSATLPSGGKGSEGSSLTPDQILKRNSAFLKPGIDPKAFNTMLAPDQENAFRKWVAENKVEFDPNEITPDYDMRGFWKALQMGDPRAATAVNPNDKQLHYPDYWKTPYDLTFSRESQWANPATAPSWNDLDQLVLPNGSVIYDERARNKKQ